jgi:hypothetical protein
VKKYQEQISRLRALPDGQEDEEEEEDEDEPEPESW